WSGRGDSKIGNLARADRVRAGRTRSEGPEPTDEPPELEIRRVDARLRLGGRRGSVPSRSTSSQRRERNRSKASSRPHRRVRARAVVPGRRYKITRRCLERRFFMTPDTPEVEQILGYILGFCLDHYVLELHAACFMSNHYHLDVTDPYGQFPAFKCKFNSLVAKALNAHRGRFDCFWSADAPCDVELVSDEDVVDRMAYTLANPVTAGLVRRAGRWPGFTTAGDAFGTQLKFSRP